MARTFVIGDIHGAYRALIQCFEKISFDYKKDKLICLGDVCDGWPEVNKAIDELLKIEDLVYILGNHDEWALKWYINGDAPDIWILQGGRSTINSYRGKIPDNHIDLLLSANLFYEYKNRLFVHAGYDPNYSINQQDKSTLIWDRGFIYNAFGASVAGKKNVTDYKEVYVGHTPTINFGTTKPMKLCEVYLMDTGAGWNKGVLTIMNIETKEYISSEVVSDLYPGFKGRE